MGIIGGAVGAVVVVGAIGAGVYYLKKKKWKQKKAHSVPTLVTETEAQAAPEKDEVQVVSVSSCHETVAETHAAPWAVTSTEADEYPEEIKI